MALKLYQNRAAYDADTRSATESTVSLIQDESAVMYDGINVIKAKPAVGDFVVVINGKKRFLSADTATAALLNSLVVAGKVYDVQGRTVRVVGGVNTTTKQWSGVCDYTIVPAVSLYDGTAHDLAVTLCGAETGTFSYTCGASAGTDAEKLADFITALDAWLDVNAVKWEAYVRADGAGILQMSTYDTYESTVTVTDCTLTKLVGSELAAETLSLCLNQIKQSATYNGMCRQRLQAWAQDNNSANCNPTTEMNGTTQLFVTFPCSKAYYDGDNGAGLRSHYATYELYLDACMVRLNELNKGIMQYRDGKSLTARLADKQVIKRGETVCPYEAAAWACSYEVTDGGNAVSGFAAGDWWLPSMYELGLLMKNLCTDYSDHVNKNITRKTGFSNINPASYRWSCCRYGSSIAWSYSIIGITGSSNFYISFAVSAVSAFTLED